MTPELAAKVLLGRLNLPLGSTTVMAWYGGHQQPACLKVWVDPRMLHAAISSTPSDFEGYKVMVEERPQAFSYH